MKHSPALFFYFLLILLLPATAAAQTALSLQWEVVNPFRFIHDQNSIDELRAAYTSLPDPRTASALERELQRRADAIVHAQRAEARKLFDCDHPKNKTQKHQCFAPYLGWFARLALNDHEKTCWDSDEHEYRETGRCADYIYPKSHRMRLWIDHGDGLAAAVVKWILAPAVDLTPCANKPLCIEFEVPFHVDQSEAISASAQLPNQTLTVAPIEVKTIGQTSCTPQRRAWQGPRI